MISAAHEKLFHRFPFVLFDRCEVIEASSSKATRLISIDEALLEGGSSETFGRSLLVEAMAQTAALFAEEGRSASSGIIVGVKRVLLLRALRPGERLLVEAKLVQRFGDLVRIEGRVSGAGEDLASGEILISLAGGAEG